MLCWIVAYLSFCFADNRLPPHTPFVTQVICFWQSVSSAKRGRWYLIIYCPTSATTVHWWVLRIMTISCAAQSALLAFRTQAPALKSSNWNLPWLIEIALYQSPRLARTKKENEVVWEKLIVSQCLLCTCDCDSNSSHLRRELWLNGYKYRDRSTKHHSLVLVTNVAAHWWVVRANKRWIEGVDTVGCAPFWIVLRIGAYLHSDDTLLNHLSRHCCWLLDQFVASETWCDVSTA